MADCINGSTEHLIKFIRFNKMPMSLKATLKNKKINTSSNISGNFPKVIEKLRGCILVEM